MSSLISVNTSDGESILPEVEELTEFHPDQLSSLVDIQEELEKLEARENVGVEEEVLSMSTVEDVNFVDHEVTIVAEQAIEDVSILPEISDSSHKPEPFNTKTSHSFDTVVEESFDVGETVTIGTPNVSEPQVVNPLVEKDKPKVVPIKPTMPSGVPQLKAIRPLPETLKGKKPSIALAPQKKNMITKVIFSPNSQSAPDAPIIFGEAGGQTIRIVGQNKTIITNPPKTITVAQAREMGLLSPAKVHPLGSNNSKGVVKKSLMMNANKLTMVKSSPTKILPLPTTGQLHPIAPSPAITALTATPHKIFIRQSPSTLKSGTFSGTILATTTAGSQGQILQIPVSQDNANSQIHQIQLPGKQVQYVRLVTSATTSGTNESNAGPIASLAKSESMLVSTLSSPRPVPVALTSVSNTSQLKMVPIAPAQHLPNSSLQNNSFERVHVSPGLSQLATRPDAKLPANNIVMVPAEYVKQFKPAPVTPSVSSPPKPIIAKPVTSPTLSVPPLSPLFTKAKEMLTNKEAVAPQSAQKSKSASDQPNGIRPRKPCNCTKSQCLKLVLMTKEDFSSNPPVPYPCPHLESCRYCDCFANGEFCFQCNCNSCFNNLDHEEERQRAIKACLERNPNAFRPKIGKGYVGDERRHNKGCNCKRSGCLKNYCECYEAKIPCSNNCKCVGCRNVEEIKDVRERHSSEGSKTSQQTAVKNKLSSEIQESAFKPNAFVTNQGARQPFNLMTQEVVEATCQCLLAQVEDDSQLTEEVERLILEEFGRCLVEIIECATRTTVNNST